MSVVIGHVGYMNTTPNTTIGELFVTNQCKLLFFVARFFKDCINLVGSTVKTSLSFINLSMTTECSFLSVEYCVAGKF